MLSKCPAKLIETKLVSKWTQKMKNLLMYGQRATAVRDAYAKLYLAFDDTVCKCNGAFMAKTFKDSAKAAATVLMVLRTLIQENHYLTTKGLNNTNQCTTIPLAHWGRRRICTT